ncbi:MAG: winged helix-turn-helix domain-containing protein [Patescibacteria group bacterium]|nr:winged helix-turn-helix domain-containing protein [Patescibacteria group bacterium]
MTNTDATHFEALYPPTTREKEVEKILTFVREGKSCQLVSLPGAGRSNLLGLLSFNRNVRIKFFGEENQKWYHFVYCNFSELRKKPLFEAEKYLFLSLVDSMRERKMEEEYKKASQILKESLSFNDELVLFQGLKKIIDILAIENEFTIVFLFDRFEEYVPMLSPEFFSNLRILRGRAKYRFSVVFSLNRPLEDTIESALFADFYEFLAGNIIYLPLFDKKGFEFRLLYMEKVTGKKIDKKILDKILNLTAGHGKLTRVSIEAMLAENVEALRGNDARYVKGKSVTYLNTKDLTAKRYGLPNRVTLPSFLLEQKTVQGALLEIWNSLTPEEQSVILGTLVYPEDSRIRSWTSQDDSNYLTNVGLIKNHKIAIPLFEEFITRFRQDFSEAEKKKIILDQSGKILKGNEIISDKLTSYEFKLLKFLLENGDKVLEREEIINAVWHDLKSKEGVTDQALDQLIFRLRKKVETNPNDPKHIQTIKGRGLKLNQNS